MKNIISKNIENSLKFIKLNNIKPALSITNQFNKLSSLNNFSTFNQTKNCFSKITSNSTNPLYYIQKAYFSKDLPAHTKLKLPTLSPSMETVI